MSFHSSSSYVTLSHPLYSSNHFHSVHLPLSLFLSNFPLRIFHHIFSTSLSASISSHAFRYHSLDPHPRSPSPDTPPPTPICPGAQVREVHLIRRFCEIVSPILERLMPRAGREDVNCVDDCSRFPGALEFPGSSSQQQHTC